MACKCNAGLEAFGLPDCSLIPERIVRVIFTTQVEAKDWQTIADFPPPSDTPWVNDGVGLWKGMYKLITPLADDIVSEKPEAVREEIGVNAFFVRESARSFTLTFARKPAEMGRLIKQLRCQRSLGAFLVDAEGVVWGLRAGRYNPSSNGAMSEDVMPIPIQPATIDGRFEFASPTTVPKWIFTFQAAFNVKDEDLVPIWAGKDVLIYQPPVSLVLGLVTWALNDLTFNVFARFATGVGGENLIPLTQVPVPLPTAYDASGTPLGSPAWTYIAPGQFQLTPPSGTAYLQFSPTALANPITPSGFDWASFRINVP